MKRTHKNEFGLVGVWIPIEVVRHPELSVSEKILYGYIAPLTQSKRGCWASNTYLSTLMGIKSTTYISTMVSNLIKQGFIFRQKIKRRDGTVERRLFLNKDLTQYEHLVKRMHDELASLNEDVEIEDNSTESSDSHGQNNDDLLGIKKIHNPSYDCSNDSLEIEKNLKESYKNFEGNNKDKNKDYTSKEVCDELSRKKDSSTMKRTKSVQSSKDKISPKNRTVKAVQTYKSEARKLGKIVESVHGKKYNEYQCSQKWVPVITSLAKSLPDEFEGMSPKKRINQALDWYAEHHNNEYVPFINSAKMFKDKFFNLEEVMKRNSKNRQTVRATPGKKSTQTNGTKYTPRALAEQHFKGNKVLVQGFIRGPYHQAKELLPSTDDVEKRATIAESLLDLHKYIDNEQTHYLSPELREKLPGPLDLVEQYLEWLEDQDWIENKSISLFAPGGKMFFKFVTYAAKQDNMNRNPLTGESGW